MCDAALNHLMARTVTAGATARKGQVSDWQSLTLGLDHPVLKPSFHAQINMFYFFLLLGRPTSVGFARRTFFSRALNNFTRAAGEVRARSGHGRQLWKAVAERSRPRSVLQPMCQEDTMICWLALLLLLRHRQLSPHLPPPVRVRLLLFTCAVGLLDQSSHAHACVWEKVKEEGGEGKEHILPLPLALQLTHTRAHSRTHARASIQSYSAQRRQLMWKI